MMPAYRSADPHPYQQNQMALPHYYQPVMEGIPPQMNVDPSKTPSAYEQAWPYIGGHGHGYPTPMQFCCGHHIFPGYWTCTPPSYSHIPTSSPPMCFLGGYPAYPEPFYAPYTPPPHFTMELPRYEYDKCMPREYHCCGCPNQPLSPKEGKCVKIEEHEPKAEKKANDVVSKNYPYPFVWMPPQYMDNEKFKNSDVREVGDQHDLRKPSEFARAEGQKPNVWNGCFPLDINDIANMIQGGNGREYRNGKIDNSVREAEDGKTNPSQQSERNRSEFPFPVIWIPTYNMQQGERRKDQEITYSPNSVEEASPALDSTPVVSRPSDDASNRSKMNGYDLKMGGSDVAGKETNEKVIPVKQMELQRSEPESHEKRVRDIPVRQTEGDMTKKETQTRVKRQSSSLEKTSKLPPVCLRVDPLPRKKNGNGSSRSPSPSKRDSAVATNGTFKSSTSSSMHGKALADAERQRASNVGAELKPKEKTIEVVEMSSERKDGERRDESESHDKTQADVKHQKDSNATEDIKPKSKSIRVLEKSSEKKIEDHINGTQSQVTSDSDTEGHENGSTLPSMGESWTNGEEINGNEAEKKVNDMTKEAMDTKDTEERKVLSDTEAAAMIQAAYRGFQVRKWEPLKKLKQIAEVGKHVTDVRGSIEALEASSNEQIDEKERVAIGEIIMTLLLKLDTIQGLHPSFREMRKSLARELTSLQEKLDSVIAKKSQLCMEDLSIGKLGTPSVGSNGECNQEQPENKLSVPGEDSSEGIIQESHSSAKQQAEEIAASENSSDSFVHGTQNKMEQGQDQLSTKNDNPSHDDETFNKSSKDEGSGCDISEVQPKTKSELEGIPNEVDELDKKPWEELPRGVIDDPEDDNIDFGNDEENDVDGEELQVSEVTNASDDDFARYGESLKVNEMEELPIGLLDDEATDSEKHEETGTSALAPRSGRGECNPALITHSLTEDLPIGLLDDDTTDSEKCEETGTSAQVLQSEGGGEYNPALIAHSLVDDIFKEAQLDQQQQLEEQEENQSNGESADWVKVEYEEDGLKGDAREYSKVESDLREENDGQSVTKAFRGDGRHGVANVDACLEVKEVTIAETPEEDVALKGAQSEQIIKDDAENKEVLSEQCVTAPLLKEVPLPKQFGEMDTNKSLIEENEKLRKMLQKLLEAGNEQLSVISNLTGRVKDLEKKLAKKKRLKTVHCRPTTSKPSCKKSSNNAGVVM